MANENVDDAASVAVTARGIQPTGLALANPTTLAASSTYKFRPPGPWLPASFSLLLLSCLLLLAATARVATTSAEIAGDSMAPTLQGIHYRVICDRCGFPVECGLQHRPDRDLAVCANCGYRENRVGPAQLQSADRVRIVPLETAGPLKRYDLIAFRAPVDGSLTVKRLLALPGERPSIEEGNLLINGQLVGKSLAQLEAMALLVHDAAYRPPPQVNASRWIATGESRLSFDSNHLATLHGTIDYRHRAASAIELPRASESPESRSIRDLDWYNQSLSRPLHPVNDLLLTATFRLESTPAASFRFTLSRNVELALTLAPGKSLVQWRVNGKTDSREFAPLSGRGWHRVSLGRCEGRWLLRLDQQRLAIDLNGKSKREESKPGESPHWQISAGNMTLGDLRIWRDIYYLHPNLTNSTWTFDRPLAADEYFVLGDNSPASTDSRHWKMGIRRDDILGKVFLLHD